MTVHMWRPDSLQLATGPDSMQMALVVTDENLYSLLKGPCLPWITTISNKSKGKPFIQFEESFIVQIKIAGAPNSVVIP